MAIAKNRDLVLLRRLLRQAQPYWAHIAGFFLLSLLATPLALLMPLPLKIAVDSGIGSRPLPRLLGVFIRQAGTLWTVGLARVPCPGCSGCSFGKPALSLTAPLYSSRSGC